MLACLLNDKLVVLKVIIRDGLHFNIKRNPPILSK